MQWDYGLLSNVWHSVAPNAVSDNCVVRTVLELALSGADIEFDCNNKCWMSMPVKHRLNVCMCGALCMNCILPML